MPDKSNGNGYGILHIVGNDFDWSFSIKDCKDFWEAGMTVSSLPSLDEFRFQWDMKELIGLPSIIEHLQC